MQENKTEEFNALEAEKNEIDILIDRGVSFKTPKRSLLRYLSKKKEREFRIKQPYAGTLDILSGIFLKMEFDEEALSADPLGESKRLAAKSAKLCAKVVAIAVLNDKTMIRLFFRIMTRYFLWRITPSTMLQLALIINQMCNFRDFTSSIRLMSGTRTTKPNPIEQNKKA